MVANELIFRIKCPDETQIDKRKIYIMYLVETLLFLLLKSRTNDVTSY